MATKMRRHQQRHRPKRTGKKKGGRPRKRVSLDDAGDAAGATAPPSDGGGAGPAPKKARKPIECSYCGQQTGHRINTCPAWKAENKTLEVAKKEANEKKLANIGAKKAAKKGGAVAVRCSALRPPARPPARPTPTRVPAMLRAANRPTPTLTTAPAAACNPLLRATRCCVQPPAQVHTAAA